MRARVSLARLCVTAPIVVALSCLVGVTAVAEKPRSCCLAFPNRFDPATGFSPDIGPSEPADRPNEPDRAGLRRDSWYFVGYQVTTIAVLYVMPESVSSWSDEQKDEYSLDKWWDNVRDPQIDSDDFYLNYVLHPYWGGAYYVRARERGYDDRAAFWYSAFMSATYEFGAEALFEEPSIQDLIVTPVGGALVGRYFMRVRARILARDAERGYRSTGDRWKWVLTDPLGAMNRQVDRWFGRDVTVTLLPYYGRVGAGAHGRRPTGTDSDQWTIGLRWSLRW